MNNRNILTAIVVILFSFNASSKADEICNNLPTEDNLNKRYTEINKFWELNIEEGTFESTSPLRQEVAEGAQKVNTNIIVAFAMLKRKAGTNNFANIVISNGRTETYLKYKEMAATLWCKGYSVYMIDHRGQGLSSRILVYNESSIGAQDAYTPTDYENRGHVEGFDFYVNDLKTFVEKEVPNNAPMVLLAHSMGGAIAARLIQEEPDLFKIAVLSSPMLDIPSRLFGCLAVDKWIEERKGEDAYAPGGERWIHSDRYPYREDSEFMEKTGKYFTSSAVRHDLWHEEYASLVTSVDDRKVNLRIGSATNGWFDQACDAVDTISDEIDKIKIPVLLLIAEKDKAVPRKKQEKFCNELNKVRSGACKRELILGARHEMFIERDTIRDEVFGHIDAFLGNHLAIVK